MHLMSLLTVSLRSSFKQLIQAIQHHYFSNFKPPVACGLYVYYFVVTICDTSLLQKRYSAFMHLCNKLVTFATSYSHIVNHK